MSRIRDEYLGTGSKSKVIVADVEPNIRQVTCLTDGCGDIFTTLEEFTDHVKEAHLALGHEVDT